MDELEGEAGEGSDRPRDVGQHDDLGLVGMRPAEAGIGRHTARGQRPAQGAAEVEPALATVAPAAGKPRRHPAGQRARRPLQRGQVLPGSVEEVDVLRERPAHRPSHGLRPALGDEAPAHLGLHLLPQALPGGQQVVPLQPAAAPASSRARAPSASRTRMVLSTYTLPRTPRPSSMPASRSTARRAKRCTASASPERNASSRRAARSSPSSSIE